MWTLLTDRRSASPLRCNTLNGTAEFDVGGKTFTCPRGGGSVSFGNSWVCADYGTLCPSEPTSVNAAVSSHQLSFDAFPVPSSLDFNADTPPTTDFIYVLKASAAHPIVMGSVITISFPPSLNASMADVAHDAFTVTQRSVSPLILTPRGMARMGREVRRPGSSSDPAHAPRTSDIDTPTSGSVPEIQHQVLYLKSIGPEASNQIKSNIRFCT